MKKRWIFLALGMAAVGAVAVLGLSTKQTTSKAKTAKAYDYTQAKLGSIEKTISTSGTLQPVSTVKVISQMSGRAENVYADYNDTVRKGQVLVSLNTDMLKLQEQQSSASVQKAQANYDLQALNYANKQALAAKDLISEYDLSSAKTTLAVAAAELASAKASFQVIETQLMQYALIKSPIDGIVLDKNVEVGQTVVESSSATASALFTLAEDLSTMEIKAAVDELDITSVKTGQEVRFTVESQPGSEFTGVVKEIHLIPVTTSNVVNYYVIISAPNKGNRLLPGMTATIDFIEQKKSDILLIPNAALRYTPSSLTAEEVKKLTFLARLPAEARVATALKYDEAVKAAAEAKAKGTTATSGTGLAGLLMGRGPGGPGGPPGGPGGFGGQAAARTTTARSTRSPSATAAAGTAAAAGAAGMAAAGRAAAQAAAQAAAGSEKPAPARKPLWYFDSEGKIACVLVEVGISDGSNTEISGTEDLSALKFILREKAE